MLIQAYLSAPMGDKVQQKKNVLEALSTIKNQLILLSDSSLF